jgi:hypothetical protein
MFWLSRKSRSLKFLEPSEPAQACNWINLLLVQQTINNPTSVFVGWQTLPEPNPQLEVYFSKLQYFSHGINGTISQNTELCPKRGYMLAESPKFCDATWDGVMCWQAAAPGSLVTQPCPDYFRRFVSKVIEFTQPSPLWNHCQSFTGVEANVKILLYVTYVFQLQNIFLCSAGVSCEGVLIMVCEVKFFFIIKPTRCTNFTNLFWHETLHVSDSPSVHHQEFIHRTLSNGTCHTGL